MVKDPAIYALTGEQPWLNVANPRPHCTIDPSLNREGQTDANIMFDCKKEIFI